LGQMGVEAVYPIDHPRNTEAEQRVGVANVRTTSAESSDPGL
jgi:hypothetical protein